MIKLSHHTPNMQRDTINERGSSKLPIVLLGLMALLAGKELVVDPVIDHVNGLECPGELSEYSVRPGDTIREIAREQVDPSGEFGVEDLEIAVMELNPEVVPTKMQPGDTVLLPPEGSCNK